MDKDNIWKSLDDLTVNSCNNLTLIDGEIYCDVCSNECVPPLYSFSINSNSKIDICSKCYTNEILTKLFDLQIIDRTTYSIEEKPLIWPCIYCKTLLGGGCKWNLLEFNYKELDVCNDCYNNIEINLKNSFHEIDDKYVICERGGDGVFLDISNIDQHDRQILDVIKDEITQKRIEDWIDTIDSIVNIDSNKTHFGTVKQWTLFTDLYEIPIFDAMTALLIDCKIGNNGRVASVVFDNHGRCSIDIIFNTFDEYLKEYNEWLQIKIKDECIYEKEFKKAKKIVQKHKS